MPGADKQTYSSSWNSRDEILWWAIRSPIKIDRKIEQWELQSELQ